MKRMTNTMMTAAAVLMLGAGVASAQTTLKAEIPFAFSVAGKVTEPGTYQVRSLRGSSSTASFAIRNTATGRTYLLVPNYHSDAPKGWTSSGTPRVAFDCSTGACALRKIWFGEGSTYEFSGPRTKSGEMQLTEIRLTSPKGD
ncbi:MAG: hypothetical protein ABI806_05415 [Candidatus Solibacter sp.]